MKRNPAVAGQFYADSKKELASTIQKFLSESKTKPVKCVGAVMPHAGYVYSGSTAAYSYNAIKENTVKNIVIIGPNHTGIGYPVSVDSHSEWTTPLGDVPVNEKLCQKIAKTFALDESAHEFEHSAEVQVPFLQSVFNDFKIVPICVGDQRQDVMKQLGKSLSENLGKEDLVIASTDFSHYVTYEQAYANDMKAIASIKNLDSNALYKAVESSSMCGYGAVSALIEYAKIKKAKKAELLKYSTSGEVSGDMNSVVGYASLVVI
jgi:hypothetical protein